MKVFRRCLLISISCAIILLPRPVLAQSQSNCSVSAVSCIQGQFASKFPFDILANIPQNKISCPQIHFNFAEVSRDFDFCFIYDFLKIIKYPLAAALLMKIYIFT
jgi:hypothetical protein